MSGTPHPSLARVLAGRARLWRNALFARRTGRAARSARHPLFALALLVIMAVLVHRAMRALFFALNTAWSGPDGLTSALAAALGFALLGVLVFDLDAAVASLLLDPDVELLRRSPLPRPAVMALKLLDAFPRTAAPLAVLALPAVLAWGDVVGLDLAGRLAAVPLLLSLWALPLGLGVALALPALRAIPARRAREGLALLSTLLLTGLWLVNVLWVPRLADAGGEPLARAREVFDLAARNPVLAPGRWAAGALEQMRRGDASAAALTAAPLLGLALAAMLLAGLSAAAHLAPALEKAGGRGAARRAPRPARGGRRPRGVVRALLERDARMFGREWTVVADVFTTAVLWTLLPLASAAFLRADPGALARAMLLTLAVGLGYEIAARTVPFERRAITWLDLAPVHAGRALAAKFLGAAALAWPLLAAISAALALAGRLTVEQWAGALFLGTAALALSLSLGLWTGAIYADTRWVSPRAMLSLGGRLVAAGLMILQAGGWLALLVLAELMPEEAPGGRILPLAALLALAFSALPLALLRGRLRRRGWSG